jgi:bifunctional DNA-binding transcriptional regulator/antitoxin component of YhaV-PrlF toxin-antitoxin module
MHAGIGDSDAQTARNEWGCDQAMTTSTISNSGEIMLPNDVRKRYGLTPNAPVRIIETRGGILLVPLTNAPMDENLVQELQAWQGLGAESWGQFPYEATDS